MATLDLRPLSLGEILDRSFILYRRHFALFVGIAAIPLLLILAFFVVIAVVAPAFLLTVKAGGASLSSPGMAGGFILVGLLAVIVYMLAYLLSQGATVSAVADLYLGRPTTIGESLRKARGEVGTLFGVTLLNGLVTMLGFIFLIVPGIYLLCRLLTAVPAAMIENLGPRESLERSFALTKSSAGRAFLILVLYVVILYAVLLMIQVPVTIATTLLGSATGLRLVFGLLGQVGNLCASVLVTPILMIAISVFYFDLRVRKEAFDLQMMLDPASAPATGAVS